MKLNLPSSPLALLALVLLYGSAVNANFDLYRGWVNEPTLNSLPPYHQELWWVFDGEPDCDMAWRVQPFHVRDDVSGDKLGIRCLGSSGCDANYGDPAGVSVLEMHFRNDPLLHWTIYKNRGSYDMIGLDGNVYGNCDPFPSDDFMCTKMFAGLQTISAIRKFRCYSSWTAGDINHCC
ncbi:hypothetical protein C8A05DRAFT_20024 [Staphylotrichum tortipilum]|uniref:Uncharacterized protein n=1 Tax=Staphylotrichum tortipilum TaxID=2831512 RepID=A0AAN6MB37_9PEZI|nr:hypothetical protein C8A05DRAFT_20024 [Staphylotrichum longicolle]